MVCRTHPSPKINWNRKYRVIPYPVLEVTVRLCPKPWAFLIIHNTIDKNYTFTLADTFLPPNADTGREQATIVYEYDFRVEALTRTKPMTSKDDDDDKDHCATRTIFMPWSSFKATYRGREKKDAPPLNIKEIKRMSILIRR